MSQFKTNPRSKSTDTVLVSAGSPSYLHNLFQIWQPALSCKNHPCGEEVFHPNTKQTEFRPLGSPTANQPRMILLIWRRHRRNSVNPPVYWDNRGIQMPVHISKRIWQSQERNMFWVLESKNSFSATQTLMEKRLEVKKHKNNHEPTM